MGNESITEWIQRNIDDDLTEMEQEHLTNILSAAPHLAREAEQLELVSQKLSHLPVVMPPYSIVDSLLPVLEKEMSEPSRSSNSVRALPSKPSPQANHAKRKRWFRSGWLQATGAVVAMGIIGYLLLPDVMGNAGGALEMAGTSTKDSSSHSTGILAEKDEKNPSPMPTTPTPPTVSSTPAISWSPTHRYQATWEENRVVVRTEAGVLQYQSDLFSTVTVPPQFTWNSDRELTLTFSNSSLIIDVVEKRIVR